MKKTSNKYTLYMILLIITCVTICCAAWTLWASNYYAKEEEYVIEKEYVVEKEVAPVAETKIVACAMAVDPKEIEAMIEEEQKIPEELLNKVAQEPTWGFDFEYICRVVAAEGRGESYEGQVAIAQCIWNTAEKELMTFEEVVNIPNRYADPVPSEFVTQSVRDACRNVFLSVDSVTEEPIEYFYSTKDGGYSSWHEDNLVHVMTIGNHKFFKEK